MSRSGGTLSKPALFSANRRPDGGGGGGGSISGSSSRYIAHCQITYEAYEFCVNKTTNYDCNNYLKGREECRDFKRKVEELVQREAAACAALKEVINEPSFFDY
ncbi:uncharacterized protein LOC112006466 [Quercus suber]|uniref:uncharacterized protein LOC112006466 n=1 Tax=Quercus suber TaxID=58331 RepID=UPI000CE2753B|nr:uncharacterized protein LOC112006466 [Quercus suber]